MKKTLLITPLIAALAMTGCNKSTHRETVATDPAQTNAAATTTEPTVGQRVDSAAARTGDAMRDAGRDMQNAADRAGDNMRDASHRAANAMSDFGHDVSAKFQEWKLSTNDIQADLAAHRDIVRTKESTTAVTKVDRSTLKSAVEGRIKADGELANLKLDVNPKGDGEIQLEGKAQTAEQVGRAIALALDTDGVTKVTSKVKLDDDAMKH